MKYPKRSQYKYTKKAYRVRNWRAYAGGLASAGGPYNLAFGEGHQSVESTSQREARGSARLREHRDRDCLDRSLGLPSCPAAGRRLPALARLETGIGHSHSGPHDPLQAGQEAWQDSLRTGGQQSPHPYSDRQHGTEDPHRQPAQTAEEPGLAQAACRGQLQVRPRRRIGADQQGGCVSEHSALIAVQMQQRRIP